MERLEFKEKVDKLFKDYKILQKNNHIPNVYWLNLFDYVVFNCRSKEFYVYNRVENKYIYQSSQFESYEQYYDELIIFKELILPNFI
jgi:hypothetical protein